MVGNGTFRVIADAAESVNATGHTKRLGSDVLIGAEEVGIGGDIVRSLELFTHPHVFCAVDLPKVCFAGVHRCRERFGSQYLRKHKERAHQKREDRKDGNGCDASRFFQTDSDTAGGVPMVGEREHTRSI